MVRDLKELFDFPYTKTLCRKVRKVSCLNVVDLFFLDEIKKYYETNMAKKTLFNELWLEEEKYKPWLKKDSNDKNYFRCKLCCSKIYLSNMGKRALKSHMQGVRQKQTTPLKSVCIFKTVRKTTSAANISISAITSKVVNIPTLTMKNSEIITGEIYWVLKVLQSNLSLNSYSDLNSLFWKMLPDSDIARSYYMAKIKLSYVINFGIATHISERCCLSMF